MNTFKIFTVSVLVLLSSCKNESDYSDAYGNFEAVETIISSQSSGEVLLLNIEEGQKCKVDDLAAIIDTNTAYLSYMQLLSKEKALKSGIDNVNANIDVLNAQKSSILREVKRAKKLLENDAATQQQVDKLEGELDVLNSRIKSTETQKSNIYAEINALKSQIEILKDQLVKCYVRNPVRGTVLEKYVEEHEIVMPGKSIYKIADLSLMDLRVYVSGSQLSKIKLGQKVKVYIDKSEKENMELSGTIAWISEKAEFTPKIIQTKEERVNLVYAVKVKVPNDGSIKVGMPGEIKF